METLELPSPASELLDAVHEALVDLILPIAPGNTSGRLGGGTTLAARWRHRNSTDIDVTVPEGTGLGRYHPDRDTTLIDRMEEAVPSSTRQRRTEKRSRTRSTASHKLHGELSPCRVPPTMAPLPLGPAPCGRTDATTRCVPSPESRPTA